MIVGDELLKQFLSLFQKSGTMDCWLWKGALDEEGRGILQHRRQIHYAHIISFCYYRYPLFAQMTVTHDCEVPNCVNPYHLRARFPATERCGENNCNAVLCPKDVKKIRKKYSQHQNIAIVAKAFQVSEGTIRDIIKGRTWKHV